MRAARRSCWAAILAHGRAWLVAPRPDLATLDRLLGLMQQRLTLMHEVARWKWNAGQPVTDAERERESLHSVVERGRGKGVEPRLLRRLPRNRRCARRLHRRYIDRGFKHTMELTRGISCILWVVSTEPSPPSQLRPPAPRYPRGAGGKHLTLSYMHS